MFSFGPVATVQGRNPLPPLTPHSPTPDPTRYCVLYFMPWIALRSTWYACFLFGLPMLMMEMVTCQARGASSAKSRQLGHWCTHPTPVVPVVAHDPSPHPQHCTLLLTF